MEFIPQAVERYTVWIVYGLWRIFGQGYFDLVIVIMSANYPNTRMAQAGRAETQFGRCTFYRGPLLILGEIILGNFRAPLLRFNVTDSYSLGNFNV